MTLDIVLIIIGAILIIVGIVGCIIPALPGTPLSYIGILLLEFTDKIEFSLTFLIFWAVVVIIVQILDYVVPMWGTKKFGGSKYGMWGSTAGLIIGLFFSPLGIIIGPFAGAVLGELLGGKEIGTALKAGFGAFLGFLAGTLVKLIVAIILAVYFFKEVITVYL